MRRWQTAVGALHALLATALPASAEPALTLSWQAPPGCPGRADVEREIANALSRLRGRGPVDVAAEVTIAEEASYRLRVKVTHAGATGERVLSVGDCAEAARAAALLVALSVENPPPPAPEPPPPARGRDWVVSAGPHLVVGLAPEAAAGLGVGLGLGASFWRLSLRGGAFAPAHYTVPGTDVGGTFRIFSGGAFACGGYPGQPLTFYGCLGGRLDHVRGTGFGASATSTASTNIGALAAGGTLEWHLSSRFRLRAELEAGYTLGDARFVIENLGTVHEIDDLRGEAALELGLVF